MKTSPIRRSTLLLVVAVFLLAACGSDGGSSEATTGVSTGDSTLATDETETSGTTGGAGSATDCPVGTWLITTESLQGFYDTVNASVGTDFSFVGKVLFTLRDDGTFLYDMEDFTVTNSIGGVATSVATIGEVAGTYQIVGSTFLTTIGSTDVAVTVIAGGLEVDGTPYLQQFLAEFPINNATFTCTGEDLIVDFPVVGTSASVRMIPA